MTKVKGEVNELLISGYEHYSREYERHLLDMVLKGDFSALEKFSPDQFVLASQPLRSAKNLIICLVAVACRYAADLGANDQQCYAMSDYFINKIEEQTEIKQLYEQVTEIISSYHELVEEGWQSAYTLPIQRTIRYIYTHLYETCSLAKIAKVMKLHPTYLSCLFKTEVGINITSYIREKKMDEAKKLLLNTEYSVSQIAEMLGFNSLSYFTKTFNLTYHSSPRKFAASRQIDK